MTDIAHTHPLQPAVLGPRFGRRRPTAGRSEGELLARVRGGDDTAFEALYDAYHRRLLAFCQHMLGSREEAEDVLQHTFLAAYRSLRAGYEVADLKPWLYTIARNRCLSVVRARREEAVLDEDAPATEGLAAEVDRRADLRMLVRDVQRLPPDQRAALVLFEVGDHSHNEIAAVLGVRREKVKALVFQAREALMGWRTARETPCAHVREQLATLRGRALGRATIRRHVELCSGCADYEAAVRCQRAALAIALPVVPAVGMRAAVLGSLAGGSGAGGVLGAGGATGAASGLASLGANGVAAKVLLVSALVGGAGVAGHAAVEKPRPRPAITATPAPAAMAVTTGARLTTVAPAAASVARRVRPAAGGPSIASPPATSASKASRGHADAGASRTGSGGAGVPAGTAAAPTGKAAAPGRLKAPGTPAQGKALGAGKAKAQGPKPDKAQPARGSAGPKAPQSGAAQGAQGAPARPPLPPKANEPTAAGAPAALEAAAPAALYAPGQTGALRPGQAKTQAGPPTRP